MKKLILFIWLLVLCSWSLLQAQTEWTLNEDILTSNGNYYRFSSSDSVFASSAGDSLYIVGNDTLEIYMNLGRTLGMVRFYGYAQGVAMQGNSATTCSLYFYASNHKGDGSTMNAKIPETFYPIDSVEVAAATVGTFDVYPLSNTNIDSKPSAYLTIRIYGITAQVAKFWLKEERISAY